MYIYENISLSFSHNEQYFRQKLQTKSKTRLMFHNFFYENRAICVTTWKNNVLPDRP